MIFILFFKINIFIKTIIKIFARSRLVKNLFLVAGNLCMTRIKLILGINSKFTKCRQGLTII